MTDRMTQRSDRPDRMPASDPVRQLFDRVFERRPPRNVSAEDPTVLAHQWIPCVDIKEEAHRFIVYVDAPGITPDAAEVHMEKGLLTIRGERKTESQDCRGSFTRIERRHGTFHRHFALPASADPRSRGSSLRLSVPLRRKSTSGAPSTRVWRLMKCRRNRIEDPASFVARHRIRQPRRVLSRHGAHAQ